MQDVSSTPCAAETVLKLTRNHADASVTAHSVSHASGCGVSTASMAARHSTPTPAATTTCRYHLNTRDDADTGLLTRALPRIRIRYRVAPHDRGVVGDVGVAPNDRLAVGVVDRVDPPDGLARRPVVTDAV